MPGFGWMREGADWLVRNGIVGTITSGRLGFVKLLSASCLIFAAFMVFSGPPTDGGNIAGYWVVVGMLIALSGLAAWPVAIAGLRPPATQTGEEGQNAVPTEAGRKT